MLKLNASYSKKVPADGEYTSQSYHANIEVELPDGLSAEQLNGKIHETFEMVRNSVEAELHGKSPLQYWCKIPFDVFFCNRQPILDNIKVAWYSKPIACTPNIIQGGINIL